MYFVVVMQRFLLYFEGPLDTFERTFRSLKKTLKTLASSVLFFAPLNPQFKECFFFKNVLRLRKENYIRLVQVADFINSISRFSALAVRPALRRTRS